MIKFIFLVNHIHNASICNEHTTFSTYYYVVYMGHTMQQMSTDIVIHPLNGINVALYVIYIIHI